MFWTVLSFIQNTVVKDEYFPSADHFENERHYLQFTYILAISDSSLPSLQWMLPTVHLIVAQSFRERVLTDSARRKKGFQSLLPCPLLCWSDGASHGKFSSPGLIKGTRRIVHQAERSGRNQLFLNTKFKAGRQAKVNSASRLR